MCMPLISLLFISVFNVCFTSVMIGHTFTNTIIQHLYSTTITLSPILTQGKIVITPNGKKSLCFSCGLTKNYLMMKT